MRSFPPLFRDKVECRPSSCCSCSIKPVSQSKKTSGDPQSGGSESDSRCEPVDGLYRSWSRSNLAMSDELPVNGDALT